MNNVRFQCEQCGNLTRFEVLSEKKSKAFYHYSLGGELKVENEEIVDCKILSVICMWCGHGRAVKEIR